MHAFGIGIPFAFVFSAFAMVPTVVLFAVFLGIGLEKRLSLVFRVIRSMTSIWPGSFC